MNNIIAILNKRTGRIKTFKYSIILLFLMLMIFLTTDNAHALENKKTDIAVLNFSANSVKRSLSEGVRDMIEVNLYKTGLFQILERNQFDLILKEQGFDNRPCDNTDCAVTIGKIVSADKVITGSISKIGGFNIAVKLVDVKTGFIEFAEVESGLTEDTIVSSVQRLTDKIAIKTKNDYLNRPASSSDYNCVRFYSLSTVPGLGQIYAGNTTKGYIFLGSFGAAAGFTGYSLYNFYNKRKEYENFNSGTGEELQSKYNASEKALITARFSIGLLGAIYLANWFDILLFNNPDKHLNNQAGIPGIRINNGINISIIPDSFNYPPSGIGVNIYFFQRF